MCHFLFIYFSFSEHFLLIFLCDLKVSACMKILRIFSAIFWTFFFVVLIKLILLTVDFVFSTPKDVIANAPKVELIIGSANHVPYLFS